VKRPIAVIAPLVGGGAGHFALGKWRRGIAWNLVDSLWLSLALTAVCAGSGRGFFAFMALAIVMRVAAIVDVVRIRRTVEDLPAWWKVILVWLAMCVVASAEAEWARSSRAEAFKIPSGSMIPTLLIGDHMYVDKRPWQPARGDVIVFKFPPDPDKDHVKRVLAIAGDNIRFVDDEPILNGQPIASKPLGVCSYQDYDAASDRWEERQCVALEETLDGHVYTVVHDASRILRSTPEVRVPPGKVFVVGDNRDNSHDSRFWGFVPLDYVKGRTLFLWWSSGPDGVRWNRINREVR
jgi:signal peptidase I